MLRELLSSTAFLFPRPVTLCICAAFLSIVPSIFFPSESPLLHATGTALLMMAGYQHKKKLGTVSPSFRISFKNEEYAKVRKQERKRKDESWTPGFTSRWVSYDCGPFLSLLSQL